MAEPGRSEGMRRLATRVNEANTASLVGEDELKWKSSTGIRVSRVLMRHVAAALPRELTHGVARFRGRYDVAVAAVNRMESPKTLHHPLAGAGPRSEVPEPQREHRSGLPVPKGRVVQPLYLVNGNGDRNGNGNGNVA
jgi:hypothetical protein